MGLCPKQTKLLFELKYLNQNNMKQKKLFNIISISLFFLPNGCSNPKPTFQDFIGTWVSEDGAEITLQKDSTCIYKNIPIEYIEISIDKDSLNNTGKWYLKKDDLGYNGYYIDIRQKETPYMTLYISGGGLLDNTPPWFLFQYIGDPDELNLYKFTKSK